ncbi:hypothetical protein QTP88_030176 [Uroleucon formosanum]
MKGAWRERLREWKKTKHGSGFSTLPKDVFPRLLTKLMDKLELKKAQNLHRDLQKLVDLASHEKKLQVLPGNSISYEDLQQTRVDTGAVSSSSSDESDIMDFVDESDSGNEEDSDENVNNLHADEAEAGEPEGDQASYNVGDFVSVMFENNKFTGRITAIREKGAEVRLHGKELKKLAVADKKRLY